MAGIGIVVIPIYIDMMGVEAYGLVAFNGVIQSWFQLFDFGFGSTLSRECSRSLVVAEVRKKLWGMLRTLEVLYLCVSALCVSFFIFRSKWVADNWLKVSGDTSLDVPTVMVMIGLIVATRWISTLYKGIIVGFESQNWIAKFSILIATARFILVVPVIYYAENKIEFFFFWQFAIACIELYFCFQKAYSLMPKPDRFLYLLLDLTVFKDTLNFTASLAITSLIWACVTQIDKVILSKTITLESYGYFSLAVSVASVISIISNPLSAIMIPRLTILNANKTSDLLVAEYRKITQLAAILVSPPAFLLYFCGDKLLLAWTGGFSIVDNSYKILQLYSLGNLILVFNAFPYYLQVAKGTMGLHLIGNLIFITFLGPATYIVSSKYGSIGAGWVWLTGNCAYFLIWVSVVHKNIIPGVHIALLKKDLLPVLVTGFVTVFLLNFYINWSVSRTILFVQLGFVFISTLALCLAVSPEYRRMILNYSYNRKINV